MKNPLQKLLAQRLTKLPPETDAFRVSDGFPWPDVFIDSLADRLLVSLRDIALPADLKEMLKATGRPVYVKRLDKDVKEPPQFLCGPAVPQRFIIRENGVSYLMDMGAGYSQGIFLDQRDNRAELRRVSRPGMKVLNTFAYTGAFSVCAALAGAQTTTLDLAQPCLSWCRENMALNGIDPDDHYFCRGDALHWMDRFARQGRKFDIIVLDPPTFSRDEKGHVWRVEKDYDHLVHLAADILAPGGRILCSTNCRKLSMSAFHHMVSAGIPSARLVPVPMPFDFDGEDYLKCIWAQN